MKVVLDYDAGSLVEQVNVVHFAIKAGIEVGDLFGMRFRGRYYGVKRTKTTIRVYPQTAEAPHAS